jgi:hypothetical protein
MTEDEKIRKIAQAILDLDFALGRQLHPDLHAEIKGIFED